MLCLFSTRELTYIYKLEHVTQESGNCKNLGGGVGVWEQKEAVVTENHKAAFASELSARPHGDSDERHWLDSWPLSQVYLPQRASV